MSTGGEKINRRVSSSIPLQSNASAESLFGAWRPVGHREKIENNQVEIINGKPCVSCRVYGPGNK